MSSDHADTASYKFVEPAAGDGAFCDLLPEDRRIGIEIVPGRKEFKTTDFLSWQPTANGRRFAVVGNPPLGYRAWLALAFVNHAASFADYIGFILPMAFQSDGKGSTKHRVKGAELVDIRSLPPNAFVIADGHSASVNALWQVYRNTTRTGRDKTIMKKAFSRIQTKITKVRTQVVHLYSLLLTTRQKIESTGQTANFRHQLRKREKMCAYNSLNREDSNIIILQNQSNLMHRQEADELRELTGKLFPAITAVLKLADPSRKE